jgi:outer membrane protein OmpA-like peptidoglycan-associated protein
MSGPFLCTGKTEDLIALGDTGQPVHKAAIQIIAALTRKSPDLAKFLAVPKSNEQGDVIDWYSPVPGEVILWASANEIDRNDARQKFATFKAGIAKLSQSLVESSKKSNQIEALIFGKLLGLASFSPDDSRVCIIKTQRITNGVTESYNQPVLSFWGFIRTEEDRTREPLYFLAHRRPIPEATPTPPSLDAPDRAKPWWRLYFWWLLPLLLLLLLLLLLGLLRGCMPNIQVPFTHSTTEINKPVLLKDEIAQSEKDSRIILKSLIFQGGSERLLPSSMPVLNELLAIMKENPTLEIEIQGHICCEFEPDGQQEKLSVQRSKIVYLYLVKNGIESKRLSYHGFGHQFPITLERNEEERIQNRRVEIKITNK